MADFKRDPEENTPDTACDESCYSPSRPVLSSTEAQSCRKSCPKASQTKKYAQELRIIHELTQEAADRWSVLVPPGDHSEEAFKDRLALKGIAQRSRIRWLDAEFFVHIRELLSEPSRIKVRGSFFSARRQAGSARSPVKRIQRRRFVE